jgi:uncharacterized protein (TIGR03083 family)
MADSSKTWQLVHAERETMADTLDGLTRQQWAQLSLCGDWTVRQTAAHILSGAEQTGPHFLAGMVANGFRFNTMMNRTAHSMGELEPAEIVTRLRARTATTNHPPAPAMAMLGEIVVHGEDIRRPLGLTGAISPAAITACLAMYEGVTFPVGGKKRIAGLRLIATDVDWSHGAGPEVSGPAMSLMLAMTGRRAGLDGLSGEGVPVLSSRLTA